MKAPPEVLDILFPKVRAEALRLLFSDPTQQRYVRELMAMSGLALRTVQEESWPTLALRGWSPVGPTDITAFTAPIASTHCSRTFCASSKGVHASHA